MKYDDKPIYYAIIIARPDLQVSKFPEDTKGKSISFADVGSTSGWLIPTYYAKEVWKIDPKTFWQYSEGATRKPLNVHLMIVEPERYLEDFIRAGASHLLVQCEPLVEPPRRQPDRMKYSERTCRP